MLALAVIERCQKMQCIAVCFIRGCAAADQPESPWWPLSTAESAYNGHASIWTGPWPWPYPIWKFNILIFNFYLSYCCTCEDLFSHILISTRYHAICIYLYIRAICISTICFCIFLVCHILNLSICVKTEEALQIVQHVLSQISRPNASIQWQSASFAISNSLHCL